MKFISLFAGIGGFDLGLERAGMECVAQVEIDDFCGKILKKHWPEVPLYKDIRDVGKENLPTAELICGGFPCQPFSNAGDRRGTEDDRYLWPEMLRVIQEVKPTWIIGENVAGLVNMEFKRSPAKVESRTITRSKDHDFYKAFLSRQEIMLLDKLCQELETEGYEVQPIIIPACAVDAPHKRERVWIVAHSNKRLGQREKETIRTGRNIAELCSKDVSNTDGKRMEGSSISGGPRKGGETSVKLTERLYNVYGRTWATEPDVGRVAHGIPERVDRLKSLGNAVVPQVVEVIGRAILETEYLR